jgi:hypothetical protein
MIITASQVPPVLAVDFFIKPTNVALDNFTGTCVPL